jgi:Ca2+-transporting ATPase
MAYNFRSERYSVFSKPFANKWLNLAVGWELIPLAAVLYVPFLQAAFSTHPLSASDWTAVLVTVATMFPFMEILKWMLRRGWFGGNNGS